MEGTPLSWMDAIIAPMVPRGKALRPQSLAACAAITSQDDRSNWTRTRMGLDGRRVGAHRFRKLSSIRLRTG
jgi:hypothetical protein